MTPSIPQITEPSAAFDSVASLAQVNIEITAIEFDLEQVKEHLEQDEQRMFFLLNADTARQDFYEIRSAKHGRDRHIIINAEAEIIVDSESIVAPASSDCLPEFDEIDEKFLHVIPDTSEGRDFYRRLRGVEARAGSIRMPRQDRGQRVQVLEEEAKQLRQTIVDNFQQLDCMERQSELDSILMRKDASEQQQSALRAQKDQLRQQLCLLQQQIAEMESNQKLVKEADNEAKRKREHDVKRLAWLDRFAPSPRPQPTPAPMAEGVVAKAADDKQSDVTTECSERDIDDDLTSDGLDEDAVSPP